MKSTSRLMRPDRTNPPALRGPDATRAAAAGLGLLALVAGQVLEIRFGIASPFGVLFDAAAALALLVLCAGLGAVASSRWVTRRELGPATWLGVSTAFGAALLALFLLALGLLRALTPAAITGVLLICLASAWRTFPHLARAARDAVGSLLHTARERDLALLPPLVALVLAPFVLRALLPPTDWDSLMYHLDIPSEWLAASRIVLPGDNYHFIYVGLLHMLYLPLLAAGALSAPAVLNLALGVLLGFAVFEVMHRRGHATAALFALIGLVSTTSLLLVASTARVDVALALLLFLACVALETSLESAGSPTWVVVAGVLLGCGVGVKFSALAFVPGILIAYAWSRRRTGSRWRRVFGEAAVIGLVLAACALPYVLKNARFVGPPLYPMGSTRQVEPWIAQAYGSMAIPSTVDPAAFAQLGLARQRVNLVDAFLHPERLTIEGEGRWYLPSVVLLALPGLLVLPRSSTVVRLVFSSLFFVAIALGMRAAMNLRYLIPAIPGLSMGGGFVLGELGDRVRSPSFRRRILAALAVLILLPGLAAGTSVLVGDGAALPYLAGALSTRDYLAGSASPLDGYGELLDRLPAHLPDTARILMLFEARDLYIRPETLQDNRLTNWPILAAYLPADPCLRGTGITHVLLNDSAFNYYVRRGLDTSALDWDAFERFRSGCLVELDRASSHVLYELRPDG